MVDRDSGSVDTYSTVIAAELDIRPWQVRNTCELLQQGATLPFIARYRKEATGSLDETIVATIRDRLDQLQKLDKRRRAIVEKLVELGVFTSELETKINKAATPAELEDLYLPFRPKRRTRAAIAREKGLEPLAKLLLKQGRDLDPQEAARDFIDPEKDVPDIESALQGARDIICEWINEDAEARSRMRHLYRKQAWIRSSVAKGKEEEALQFRDYFDWQELARKAPSHRILAVFRGEKEGLLTVQVRPDDKQAITLLESQFIHGSTEASRQVRTALVDAYKRLLRPSLETEFRKELKQRADVEAIRIFADNLRHLLMAPPLGPKRVLAVDPGFRTGCKLACLDPQGNLLHSETIYPHNGTKAEAEAAERIRSLVHNFDIQAIAVGNGTAGRETERFIRRLELPSSIIVTLVDERGASVYSASEIARQEFPDQDVTIRGAASIGRRLMDPLAELVKIDPKSIGVGQYQHDVDQKRLKAALDDVVMSCVNAVGVDVNTASVQLLTYVAGLGPRLAGSIVAYRAEHGPFRDRKALLKVPRLGAKAFQQAAGFLRIPNGENPLDASAVHPESYPVVERMAADLGCSVRDLMESSELRSRLDPAKYADERIGLPTLEDIIKELAKPGRDPRRSFDHFTYMEGVESIEQLKPGMKLPGIVTNVTAFGAFVDIGVHRDGLVHISELADRYVSDPSQVVRAGQTVTVRVLDIDLQRNRISLSMKSEERTSKPRGMNRPFAKVLKPQRKGVQNP